MTAQFIIETLIRSLAAVIIGGVIGSERARHGRAAGMRTHILVCLGACMTSMTSVYVSNVTGIGGDVFRIPAQVISGIGFLGAGMIILKNNNVITGLTTAAGVWTTATIGVALGYGYYVGAAIVAVLFMATIVFLTRFERYKKSTEILYIEIDDPRCLNSVIKELEKALPDMVSYQVFAPKSGCNNFVGLNVVLDSHIDDDIESLLDIEHIVFAVAE